MAKGILTRRGGGKGEPTPPPSINFISATLESVTFTITNNSVNTRAITYGQTTPPDDETILLEGLATSDEITITGLEDGTSYTFYAQAEDSVIIETILQTLTWEPIQATGGTVTNITVNSTDYRVHSFTSVGTSTFSVQNTGTDPEAEYLIVAGGGGGGTNHGGGGGAGGLLTSINTIPIAINAQNYTVVVGGGGAGGPNTAPAQQGQNGANSSALGFTASGGGGGGGRNDSANTSPGRNGGSGGGGGGSQTSFPTNWNPGTGISGQGNSGGVGINLYGGGGGGAGSAGQNSPSGVAGVGGAGLSFDITGTSKFYAAGGGGSFPGVSGGSGIGGSGSSGSSNAQYIGTPPVTNTGSGGGGGGAGHSAGGSGASGIVIIRYPLTRPNQ